MPTRQDPPCPNLKELFGDRFKIGHDPAAVTWGEKSDPWMMTVLCKGGVVIYPFSDGKLAVEIDYHGGVAKQVAAIPGVRSHQDGDNEHTFVFPLELFDEVAAIVKPRRRRRMTEEQKAISRARLANYAFPRKGQEAG
jgi:hypothetical protein